MRRAAAVLFAAHVVGSPIALRLAALLTAGDGPIHAAEFAFPAHASLRSVLDMLRHARPVQHRLTLPEGLTAAQIMTLVDGAEALDGAAAEPAEAADGPSLLGAGVGDHVGPVGAVVVHHDQLPGPVA